MPWPLNPSTAHKLFLYGLQDESPALDKNLYLSSPRLITAMAATLRPVITFNQICLYKAVFNSYLQALLYHIQAPIT
jgi:hypothetical protein